RVRRRVVDPPSAGGGAALLRRLPGAPSGRRSPRLPGRRVRMTTLLALASPELCAAALRQPVPASAEDAVRVIGAGATAMGLDVVCTPWDQAAEAAAVRARLGAGPSGDDGRLEWADTVTRWLVATPDHRPVVGV